MSVVVLPGPNRGQSGRLSDRSSEAVYCASIEGRSAIHNSAEGRGYRFYRGVIQAGIGDVSDFRPADSQTHYVVGVTGGGSESSGSRLSGSRTRLAQALPEERLCALGDCPRWYRLTAGSEMYRFQPGKRFRHLEGGANYGASWCISLSYLQFDAAQTTPDLPQR